MGSKSTFKKRVKNKETKWRTTKLNNKNLQEWKWTTTHFFHSFFLFFFLLILVCTIFFSFWTFAFYTRIFFFSFIMFFLFFSFLFFFFFFFPFQQVTRKWNHENKGTFIKQSINPPHLFETHSQNNSNALFLTKV